MVTVFTVMMFYDIFNGTGHTYTPDFIQYMRILFFFFFFLFFYPATFSGVFNSKSVSLCSRF